MELALEFETIHLHFSFLFFIGKALSGEEKPLNLNSLIVFDIYFVV